MSRFVWNAFEKNISWDNFRKTLLTNIAQINDKTHKNNRPEIFRDHVATEGFFTSHTIALIEVCAAQLNDLEVKELD